MFHCVTETDMEILLAIPFFVIHRIEDKVLFRGLGFCGIGIDTRSSGHVEAFVSSNVVRFVYL